MTQLATQNANTSIFSTESMGQITHFAELMASGKTMLPEHLQGKPADCMAVAIQAASWGMNPFVVAQKTHLVNGTLGYEAQLVNAVISSSRAIVGRFHYRAIGDWSKWKYQGRKITKNGRNNSTYSVDAHGGINENGLGVQCGAILAGDEEITWDDILYIEHIDIRNSPLWKSRPLQQMKYLAVKYWGRIYAPEVLLGVYTPDELASEPEPVPREEKDITPKADDISVSDVFDSPEPAQQAETVVNEQSHPEPAIESEINVDDVFGADFEPRGKKEELGDLIDDCGTLDELFECGGYIAEALEAEEITKDESEQLRRQYQIKKNGL
jgi:hypothetical protein